MADVIVIGAGPAGLSAALDAAEAGHRCTLIEAGATVGGMAGSFEFAGQRVDYGSHRLHCSIGERHRTRFERLLGADLQMRPRNGRIRLRERWIGFPLRTVNLFTQLPWSFGLRVACELVARPLRSQRGRSFDAEIRARFGATVADEFYGPYARKLYGVEPGALDAELARRRVSATGGGDVARRVVRAARPAGRQFLYPRTGYGRLSEALADAAVAAGVDLRLSTTVARLELRDRSVALGLRPSLREHGAAAAETLDAEIAMSAVSEDLTTAPTAPTALWSTLDAETAMSTVPVPILAAILDPGPPLDVVAALARCRTRAMVLAYLAVDRHRYTEFDAHYFPGPQTRIARLSEPKNYRDGDDPAGRTVLCAEIPCWADDNIWRSDDDSIAALAISDLEGCGLPPVEPSMTTVRRLRSVYPVYETSTMPDRVAVDDWLASLAGRRLVSFGRQGLAVLDNLHHVMDMGSDAAAALAPDGFVQTDRWLSSLDGYRSHVVDD